MVTKTHAELVVQIMLATLAPFFGNVREDLRAMFAFHESEIARQASESLHLVQRALVAMTTFFTRKMDELREDVKASFPDCASNEFAAALVGKTVDLHAEIKSMVDAFMSNMSAAAMSPAKKTTITIDALPDVKLTFSPTELAEWRRVAPLGRRLQEDKTTVKWDASGRWRLEPTPRRARTRREPRRKR